MVESGTTCNGCTCTVPYGIEAVKESFKQKNRRMYMYIAYSVISHAPLTLLSGSVSRNLIAVTAAAIRLGWGVSE